MVVDNDDEDNDDDDDDDDNDDDDGDNKKPKLDGIDSYYRLIRLFVGATKCMTVLILF